MVEREVLNAGRGPKGWTGSDMRLGEAVAHRLKDDRLLDARGVEIAVDGDVVTLTGEVPGASDVAHAEMLARETPGVASVRNFLRLRPGPRAVEKLQPEGESKGLQGKWGRWLPPVIT
jgi:osmotically-inducible protein OsmY